jgi:hypothetical protein
MKTSLTMMDFIIIGSIVGFVCSLSVIITIKLLSYINAKAKMALIQSMIDEMEEKIKTEVDFSEIVENLQKEDGGLNDN